MVNDNDYIICEICGKKLKRLTYNHLKIHNITLAQYKEKYPNSPTISENTLNKYSEAAYINAMKKTDEERQAIGKYLANCWWSKYNSDIESQKQYRDKLSKSVSAGILNTKVNNPDKYKEINLKRSLVRKSRFKNNETSELFRDNSRKGAINLWNKLTEQQKIDKINKIRQGNMLYWESMTDDERKEVIKSRFNNKNICAEIDGQLFYFRSKFEKFVANFFNINNIEFEYESLIIKLNNDKYHKFHLIDFYIPKINTIIECKSLFHNQYTSDEILEDIEIKKQSAKDNGYNYNVIWYGKKEYILNQLNNVLANLVH